MRILLGLLREIPKWDRASQIALLLAVVLLAIDLVVLSTTPDLRTPASIGAVGLLLAIQGIFLWGNRKLVTPYTQAQRHFMNGEFEQVVSVLKDYIEEDEHPIIDALVVLGNAYRNLGQLVESESVLRIAIARRQDYNFALYGLGKTLMAKGNYADAIKYFRLALEHNFYDTANFDLAHAYYHLGKIDQIEHFLNHFDYTGQAYQKLFAEYLLHQVADYPAPDEMTVRAGLSFWEAEAERFAHSPYGQAIAGDVERLKQLL